MGRLIRPLGVSLLCLTSLIGPASAAASNTWTSFGPSAAQVLALAASPDAPGRLYAATESGVWKSTSSGDSWAATTAGPTGLGLAMVANPGDADDVVVAGLNCSVWVSSDGGSTWSHPETRFDGIGSCNVVLAWSPSGLYAVARGKLYSSADGGLTWSLVGTPPDGDFARSLVVLPTMPATIYVGTEVGTVRSSTDGGATWSNRSTGLPTSSEDNPFPDVYRLAVDPANASVLYAEVGGVGLFRTTDGGGLWEAVVPPEGAVAPLSSPVTLATTPTTLTAAGGHNLFRSQDGGATWTAATRSPGGLGSGFVTGFLADPSDPDALYMAAFGVYRSLDAGDTFTFKGNGLEKAVVHSIVPVTGSPGSYLVATEGIGVQRTDDDGASWRVVNDGVIGQTLYLTAHPSDGDVFFLIGGGHLWKTTDGGGHWATSDAGFPYGASAFALDPSAPATVYTAQTSTVYRSTDGGTTWSSGSPLPAPGGTVRHLAVDPTDGNRVYAGTDSAFYGSTDAGATWTRLHTELITDLHVARDGDAFIGTDFTIRRFEPGSSTPSLVATLPDIFRGFGEDPEDPDTLYAATLHGVYQSVDSGGRWGKLTTEGLDDDFITDVSSIAPGHLMVGARRGTASIDLVGPEAVAAQADEITESTVRFSGSANPVGSSSVAFFEFGRTVAYGSTTTVTAIGSGSAPVTLIANPTGLSPGTTYHYRLVVQSGGGIAVTSDATFTTSGTPILAPTVATGGTGAISATAAEVVGTVNPNGASTTYWFEYGTTTAYGQKTPSTSTGAGSATLFVETDLTGLSSVTTYHYRLVAENAGGRSFGSDRFFTTTFPAPLATTGTATVLSSSSARVTGGVVPRGSFTSYRFEYGPTTSYGLETPAGSAGSGNSTVAVSAELSGLTAGTTYHYRLVAWNGGGTTFGADRQFTTASSPPTMGAVETPTLRSGRLGSAGIPLTLAWNATPGSAAICSYEVHRGRIGVPATSFAVVETTTLLTSSQPATGLYYRVRALGCDSTQSAFAESVPIDLRLLQESTSALRRGAGWSRVAMSGASGGYVLRTTTHGARLALSFTGRSLALFAPKGPRYGGLSISLDGGPETRISLYHSSLKTRVGLYVVNLPTSGPHKLVIRARSVGSRRRADIDAFAVVG